MLALLAPLFMQAAPPPEGAAAPRVVHLDDAVQIALKNQPSILQARGLTAAAAGRVEEQRAGLLPQVTASALYEKIHRPTTASAAPATAAGAGAGAAAAPVAATPSGTADFWSFGATASQLIYDFNQTWDRWKGAVRAEDSLRAQEKVAQLAVLLNVRRAYFSARATRALVRVAEETLANETKHFAQIQGFVVAGTHPEIDLVQERTTMANDRVALINAQGNYEIARAQLNQAMGVVGDTAYEVADEGLAEVTGEDGPDEQLARAALANRPELEALQHTIAADDLTVKSYEGGYGPTLSAIGGASYTGTALDSLGPNWNVGASLSWPLFQGGVTKGFVHEWEGNLSAAKAQLDAEKLQVRFDVAQAVLAVRAAKASIAAANDALTNARDQLRLAEGRYTQGVGSIIELGDAQVTVTNTGAQVVQAEFNLATARAQLLTALGKP
jgi:outer membrane protein